MLRREPIVASRCVTVDLGSVLTYTNPAIQVGSTVGGKLVNYRSHRDGVMIDGTVRNWGGLYIQAGCLKPCFISIAK